LTTKKTPAHYIKPLSQTTFPKRYVYLDSEAWRIPDEDGRGELQFFRLASAFFERYSGNLNKWIERPMEHFGTTTELWYWIDSMAVARTPMVVWAHNLGYDMRITRALTDLPNFGWQFEALRLDDDLAWAKAKRLRDGATITFCDFYTFVACALEAVGVEVGLPKVDLPDDDDSDEDWYERCDRDVEILARGWRTVRDFVFANDLGPFRQTGAAMGWAVFKRSFLEHRILCHDREEVREIERHAAYAGRCEVYAPGVHNDVSEYDYAHAYVSLCVDRPLPNILTGYSFPVEWGYERLRATARELGMELLVTGTVRVPDCQLPVLPYRAPLPEGGSKVIWPTGTFTGSWWLPEIEAAVDRGAEIISLDSVHIYKTEPVLDTWARWLIDVIENHPSLLIRRVAKQWARTLVGRFGMRYPVYVNAHTTDQNDLWAGWWIDGETGDVAKRALQVGDQVFVAGETLEGRDTSPAMMSYIMSLTRLRILEAIETAGFGNVLYCDTDGLLVTQAGADRLEGAIPNLREKSRYKSVTVIGPKQLVTDGKFRVSGMPKPQRRNKNGSYEVELFERMRHGLQEGRTDRVYVQKTSMFVTGKDGRRIPDGNRTKAITVE
jgi:hypothetical protein